VTIFDTAIDTLFDDDNLAVDATYTPAAGGPVSVRVIIQEGVDLVSVGASDLADRRTVIGIRKSDIAAPVKDDTLLVGVTTYTVDVIVDDDGLETRVAVH